MVTRCFFKSNIARNEEWSHSAWRKNLKHAARALADDAGLQTDSEGGPLSDASGGSWNYAHQKFIPMTGVFPLVCVHGQGNGDIHVSKAHPRK